MIRFLYISLLGLTAPLLAQADSGGIELDDPSITGWAIEVVDFQQGSNVEAQFSDANLALGPARDNVMHIVSLGRGGVITLAFGGWIEDGEGWDFAVFENSFGDLFLELAYVEVSQDGQNWIRFPSLSLTKDPVPTYGVLKPEDVSGLAGKYRAGLGTPFDLSTIGLDRARYVRVIDIIGDGSNKDSEGNAIYDPHPTIGSAGFDLDAVAVRNGAVIPLELAAYVTQGQLVLTWQSEPGRSYAVESSTDNQQWAVEATTSAEGDSTNLQLPLPTGPAFYRVRLQ